MRSYFSDLFSLFIICPLKNLQITNHFLLPLHWQEGDYIVNLFCLLLYLFINNKYMYMNFVLFSNMSLNINMNTESSLLFLLFFIIIDLINNSCIGFYRYYCCSILIFVGLYRISYIMLLLYSYLLLFFRSKLNSLN